MNRFISIEGIEGVGKSTLLRFIENYFTEIKQPFVLTREPGGTPIAEELRRIVLTPNAEETITPDTELLLMFAGRSQHIARVIMPALQAGKWVITDRFVDASYAYQGGGRSMDVARIALLEDWIVHGVRPVVTFLLDAPPAVGLARVKNRGPHDRIEKEKMEFFERVRDAYLWRAKQDTVRFRVIDATRSEAEVTKDVKNHLDELVREKTA